VYETFRINFLHKSVEAKNAILKFHLLVSKSKLLPDEYTVVVYFARRLGGT